MFVLVDDGDFKSTPSVPIPNPTLMGSARWAAQNLNVEKFQQPSSSFCRTIATKSLTSR